MARVKLDLSIPDPDKFQDALAEARRQGFSVSRSFQDLGMASGFIDATGIDALLQIDGVASVAPDLSRSSKRSGGADILTFKPRPR